MPKQAAEGNDNNVLVSAARVVGTALGKVKRLTDAASATQSQSERSSERRRRATQPPPRPQAGTKPAGGTASASPQSAAPAARRTPRPANQPGQATGRRGRPLSEGRQRPARRPRAVALATDDDVVGGPQAGGSRSPRQTESSRRGKSRTKRSKSGKASRR